MSYLPNRTKLKSSALSHSSSRNTSVDSRSKTQSPSLDANHHLSAESLTDRATLSFVRRTLRSQLGDKGRTAPAPIDEILPPLTSSNEVDLQLYAFIAIIIREYIQTWYQKITSDQIFVEEVVKTFAHCTRALEQRLRKTDLESLLFDELPELLEAHFQAYNVSHLPLHQPQLKHDSRHIYHLLWPLPALAPIPNEHDPNSIQNQARNESAYRQLLVQGILALLLPTEDLENDCIRSLITEILSELLLGSFISEKVSEPWLLWEGITKLAEIVKSQTSQSEAPIQTLRDQSTSSTSKAAPQDHRKQSKFFSRISELLQILFWVSLRYCFLLFSTIQFFITMYASSSSLPNRSGSSIKKLHYNFHNDQTTSMSHDQDPKKPLLAMNFWSCGAKLLDLEARMPWLKAALTMLQWAALTGPGKIGQTDRFIDKSFALGFPIHSKTSVCEKFLTLQRYHIDHVHCIPATFKLWECVWTNLRHFLFDYTARTRSKIIFLNL